MKPRIYRRHRDDTNLRTNMNIILAIGGTIILLGVFYLMFII